MSTILDKQSIKDLYMCPDCNEDTRLEIYNGSILPWVINAREKNGFKNAENTRLIVCHDCGRIFSSLTGAKRN